MSTLIPRIPFAQLGIVEGDGTVNLGDKSMSRLPIPQNGNLADNSVAIGYDCMFNIGGVGATTYTVYNTAMGHGAMYVKLSSSNCTVIGADAFGSFKDNADRAIGDATGVYHDYQDNINTGGDYVTAVGQNCLTYTSGSYNTGLGAAASVYATTGSYNTSIGYLAGAQGAPSGSGPFLQAGSNNTFLGASASCAYLARDGLYMTAIGSDAIVGTSDTIVLGRVGTDVTCIGKTNRGNVAQFTGADLQLGGGVHLGNAESSGSQVLDWYEEKDFTPIVTGVTIGGGGTAVYVGKLTRIGRLVTFNITLYAGVGTTTGTSVNISGLTWLPVMSSVCISTNQSTNNNYGTGAVGTGGDIQPQDWAITAGQIAITGSYIAVA